MLKYCCPLGIMSSSIMGFDIITHKAQTHFCQSHFLITLKINVSSNDNYLLIICHSSVCLALFISEMSDHYIEWSIRTPARVPADEEVLQYHS